MQRRALVASASEVAVARQRIADLEAVIARHEARTQAIGYPVQRYKIVAVMLSGLFAGLAGVLYAIQNRFAAPDFVFFLISGEVVIFNVMGGIGTLVGPIVGSLLAAAVYRFVLEPGGLPPTEPPEHVRPPVPKRATPTSDKPAT